MTAESTCRSCGAPIMWAITDRGRRMPLSKATERRTFTLEQNGDATICRSVVTYDSHFTDCPDADRHRTT